MNRTSLFSHAGQRLADRYSPSVEPPTSRDELRDEAIAAAVEGIWKDAEWLEASCSNAFVHISPELCDMLVPIRSRLAKEPAAEDGDYRAALRALIACMDSEVSKAAVSHVDCDAWCDEFTGGAA